MRALEHTETTEKREGPPGLSCGRQGGRGLDGSRRWRREGREATMPRRHTRERKREQGASYHWSENGREWVSRPASTGADAASAQATGQTYKGATGRDKGRSQQPPPESKEDRANEQERMWRGETREWDRDTGNERGSSRKRGTEEGRRKRLKGPSNREEVENVASCVIRYIDTTSCFSPLDLPLSF